MSSPGTTLPMEFARQVDAVALDVEDCREPERHPGPAAGTGTAQGPGGGADDDVRRERGRSSRPIWSDPTSPSSAGSEPTWWKNE